MKIAILGSAPSSVMLAPFKNEAHAAWVQGKIDSIARAHAQIDGEFDIWGCSPGCWAVIPRATRWFELHRWEPGQQWFGPEYLQFLRDFKGIVYTGGAVPEVKNHVVYPIDEIEEQFASYNLTSSVALMQALAIRTIEQIRRARRSHQDRKWAAEAAASRKANNLPEPQNQVAMAYYELPKGIDPKELELNDEDDVIGLWGIDMAAGEEYAYQRPGCQNMVLEALRRFIGVYLPPESDLMRPMPVYGISEWDHNYIKITSRSRELNQRIQNYTAALNQAKETITGAQGEMVSLNHFVSTWSSPYGMRHGLLLRQEPGTGLGSGITHYDGRPITRMTLGAPEPSREDVMKAMAEKNEFEVAKRGAAMATEFIQVLTPHAGERGNPSETAIDCLRRIIAERASAHAAAQEFSARLARPQKAKKRRR